MRQSRRVLVLAREAIAAGDLARASSLVVDAGLPDSPQDRAALLRLRVQLALIGGGDVGEFALLAEGAEPLIATIPVDAGLVLADAALLAMYANQSQPALDYLHKAKSLVASDKAGRHYVDLLIACASSMAGHLDEVGEALPKTLEPFLSTGSIVDSTQALQSVVYAAAATERYDLAATIAQRAVSAARQTGTVGTLPLLLCLLANSLYFLGDYDAALLAAGQARDLADGLGQSAIVLFASTCAALVHSARGNGGEVERLVTAAAPLVDSSGMTVFGNSLLAAQGLAALATGDFAAAVDAYGAINDRLADSGRHTGVIQWRANWVEALAGVGRPQQAHAAMDEFEDATALFPLRWSRTTLARCRGLLAADDWRSHLQRSVHVQPTWMSRLELARTHLVWAERAHAEARADEAGEHASIAVELFQSVAAGRWADRARLLLSEATTTTIIPAAGEPQIMLCGLGPLTVVRGNVEQVVPTDAVGRLLRYLIVAGGRAPVAEVLAALWPDVTEEVALARLRNLLSRTRRLWGDLVVRDGSVLRWAQGVVVDVDRFEQQAAEAIRRQDRALGERALQGHRGELLPGARFSDWAAMPRERIRRTLCALLRFLAGAAAGDGEVDLAIDYLEKALAEDPDNEGSYVDAIRILLDAGRPGAARRFLDRARVRNQHLGVPDSADLAQLVERLQLTS